MNFDEPRFVFPENTLNGRYQIDGNETAVSFIEKEASTLISCGTNLYQAQEVISNKVKEAYGVEWYDKNAEAVNFIIEIAYADDLRREQPFIDKKGLEEYEHSSILW